MKYLKLFTFYFMFQIVSGDLSRIYSNVTCVHDEECHNVMGNRTNCIYGMCQCLIRYHISDLNTCIEDRGLHEGCDANDQCYWGPEMIDKIECNDGICLCKPNYIEASGRICIRFFLGNGSDRLRFYSISIFGAIFITIINNVQIF